MSDTVLLEQEGRVAILTINRPDKLNTLNEEVRNKMMAHLERIEVDDSIFLMPEKEESDEEASDE